MSRLGIASLLLAGFCLLIVGIFKLILQSQNEYVVYLLALSGVFLLASLFFDRAVLLEFLSMRTTKHGMNMGALILLTVVLLTSANYIAYRHNKSFDWTQEGLNSISDQSVKVLDAIKEDLQIKFFFDLRDREAQRDKAQFREIVQMYQEKKPSMKYEAVNVLNQPALAKEFGVNTAKATAFVVYKGQKNRLQSLDEQGLTMALINVTREKKKVIYFLKGHGELSIDASGGGEKNPDIGDLKQALVDTGYEVKSLDFTATPNVPEDASVVAIVGPRSIFLEAESKFLLDYAKKGGHLFIAADPGMKHNIDAFVKNFGINFTNAYVLDGLGQQFVNSAAVSLGIDFSKSNPITANLRPGADRILFNLATVLKKEGTLPAGLTIDELVKTGPLSLSAADIPKGPVELNKQNGGPHVVAMAVHGKFDVPAATEDKDKNKNEFMAIVFGDSDFLVGGLFRQDLNRDVVLNSFAYLSKDAELISIRPKSPKGTSLQLTSMQLSVLVYGIFIPMIIFFFFASGWTWYRRRAA